MILLVTGMVICYAHRGALPFAAPTPIKELQISKTDMGFLLSAFFLLYSFMQMPAGWLVDRFGVKRSYALGFVVWSIASACTGLAGGFVTLIVLQVILGVGQSVAFPASSRAVANWFQNKERGTVTAVSGIQNFGGNLGGIIAPFLTGYLADKTESFAAAFVICGALLVVGIFSYVFLIGQTALTEDPALHPVAA